MDCCRGARSWCYFRKWRDGGIWEQTEEALRARVREAAGREATPSAAIIDSQSVQATEKGASVLNPGPFLDEQRQPDTTSVPLSALLTQLTSYEFFQLLPPSRDV